MLRTKRLHPSYYKVDVEVHYVFNACVGHFIFYVCNRRKHVPRG